MKTAVALSIAALTIAGVVKAADRTELESLRSQAGSGDVKAQLDLAHRYRDGKGVA